jgi:hypothetical protein
MWYAFAILGSLIGAAYLRMIYGYLTSGEPFNLRKMAASSIMTFIVALPIASTMISSGSVLDWRGLLGACVGAVGTGWGIVLVTKDISKLEQGKKGENTGHPQGG